MGSIERGKDVLDFLFALQDLLQGPEPLAYFQLHPAALHGNMLDPLIDGLCPWPDYAHIISAPLCPVLLRRIDFVDFGSE